MDGKIPCLLNRLHGNLGMASTLEHPDYQEIDHALSALKARVGPPESHGILCGMLSTGRSVRDGDWLTQVVTEESEEFRECDSLQALFESTRDQLGDPNFSFRLLLPGDDSSLRSRTEALALWCSGFLYGLGVGGVTEATQLPGDAAEILGDLAKIASVDYELEEAGDAEERAYEEVVEYVRVGALLVFESLRGPRVTDTVH